MTIETISTETLDLLRKFDTPTICNVIEWFDYRQQNTGFMDDRIKACFSEMPPMVWFGYSAHYFCGIDE